MGNRREQPLGDRAGGNLYHFDGLTWATGNAGHILNFSSVAGSSATNVMIAGPLGASMRCPWGPMHSKEVSQHVGKLLRRLGELKDEDVEEVLAVGNVVSFARGEKMVEAGAPLTSAGLVLDGVLAEQVLTPEGSITVSFSVEGDFVGPIADLLARQLHASQDIVALAPSRIVEVDWQGYVELIERNHTWTRFHSTVMERLLILKSERERQLLASDAAARLSWFEHRFPTAARVLPLKEVASFLGITPVYLSRLRRRRVLARRAKAR